ncbi:uncharacterized protein LY89DRAFT_767343 [Mollisia scopiformis]|uniref:Uncharacterized protein n=1 Tax=Mollisia scopiformis TaxID=149040 RepID=A0A132B3P9_MOLSC|nr:uncharacterized protein LY89DRAFT_767343 [Mollisia scopiformis]KUJ07012.1 hypothetical protein LY89DRAFT_767343 [Mollisia scopiformis]
MIRRGEMRRLPPPSPQYGRSSETYRIVFFFITRTHITADIAIGIRLNCLQANRPSTVSLCLISSRDNGYTEFRNQTLAVRRSIFGRHPTSSSSSSQGSSGCESANQKCEWEHVSCSALLASESDILVSREINSLVDQGAKRIARAANKEQMQVNRPDMRDGGPPRSHQPWANAENSSITRAPSGLRFVVVLVLLSFPLQSLLGTVPWPEGAGGDGRGW